MGDGLELVGPDGALRAMRGGIWNAGRERLLATLVTRDPIVAGLYRRAVDCLGERPLSIDALAVSSQCIRELVNRLPGVLGEVELDGFQSESGAAKTLSDLIAKHGLETVEEHGNVADSTGLRESVPTGDGADAAQRNGVVVPRDVLDAALEVAKAYRAGTSRSKARRSALVLGTIDGTNDPTLALATDAVQVFEGRRHPRDDVSGWLSRGPEYYVENLEVIELVLESRLGRFFDVVAELRALLERANTRANGAWVAPNADLVRQVLPRLADLQHRRVFYGGLQNPEWVKALDKVHAFDNPPAQRVDEDGRLVWMQWPQGDYLLAMAPEAPAAVAAVLARVVVDQTAWNVREMIARAAALMPADEAARLKARIVTVIEDRRVGPHIGLDVVKIIEVLAAGGKTRQAKRLAQALLQPRAIDTGTMSYRQPVGAGIDAYWYEEALNRLVKAFAGSIDIFKSLVSWLDLNQQLSGTYSDGSDYSTTSRPSVSDHPQNYRFDRISDPLIDAVRDTAITLIRDLGPAPIAEILRRRPAPILKRIELYVLSEMVAADPRALAIAADQLTDEKLVHDYRFHREFSQLAAAALPLLDAATYETWEGILLAGPKLDDEQKARIAARYDEMFSNAMSPDEAIAVYSERERLERLSAIGAVSLRGRAVAALSELVSKYGEPEHPGFLSWHSSLDSDTSYVPTRELAEMAPDEVLDLVAQPCDTDSFEGWRQRSALVHAFGDSITQRADEFSSLAAKALTLQPEFAARFISGLRDSMKKMKDKSTANDRTQEEEAEKSPKTTPLDWNSLLRALNETDIWRATNDVAGDAGWRLVRREICSLLEDAAPSTLPRELLPTAANLAASMINDPDPTPEDEERYDASNMDPLTHSLSAVRPSAVRTLFCLAAAETAERKNAEPSDTTSAATVAALTRIARLLEPQRDHSLATAAAIGERTGWLLGADPQWLDAHRAQLLSADPFGDVFVTTTLALYRPHPKIVEFLAPAIEQMLRRAAEGEELTGGLRHSRPPLQLIGDHLVRLYIWGHIELDFPLLVQFFTDAPVSDRATVLGHLGWQFFHMKELEAETVQRAGALWDSRVAAVERGDAEPAELAEFDWWVRCGLFDAGWWLPRLTHLTEKFQLDFRTDIEDELEAASQIDLSGTLKAINVLIRTAGAASLPPYGLREAAPVVLARALDSGEPELVAVADDLINYVGRRGDLQIQADVDTHRQKQALYHVSP